MEITYNNESFEVDDDRIENIDYFDVKTPKAKIEKDVEIYWCPFKWEWRLISEKEETETRYNNSMKTIYFNEKVFLVERKAMRKHFKDDKLVDVCLLPIGLYAYWDNESEQWDFLGYK